MTVATEHRAVLDTCRHLEARGCRVTVLPVGADGLIDLAALEAALEPKTILVSVMAANNEIGVLQPLAAIGRLTRARGILFHTDAAQAFGRVPLDVNAMGIDLLSISAHKIHGPQGVGALYVRTRQPTVRLAPLFDGGGHERGLRPGTLNAPGHRRARRRVGAGRGGHGGGGGAPRVAPRSPARGPPRRDRRRPRQRLARATGCRTT